MINKLIALLLLTVTIPAQAVRYTVTLNSDLNMAISDSFSPGVQTRTIPAGEVVLDHLLSPSNPSGYNFPYLVSGAIGSFGSTSVTNARFEATYTTNSWSLTCGMMTWNLEFANVPTISNDLSFRVSIEAPQQLDGILRINMTGWEKTDTTQPCSLSIVDVNTGKSVNYHRIYHPPFLFGGTLIIYQEMLVEQPILLTAGNRLDYDFRITGYGTFDISPAGGMISAFPMSNARVVMQYVPRSAISLPTVNTIMDSQPGCAKIQGHNHESSTATSLPLQYMYMMFEPNGVPGRLPLFLLGYPTAPISLGSGCTLQNDGSIAAVMPTVTAASIFHVLRVPLIPGMNFYLQGLFVDASNINNSVTTQMLHIN